MIADQRHIVGRLVGASTLIARLGRVGVTTLGVLVGLTALYAALTTYQLLTSYSRDFVASYLLTRAMADGIDPYLPLSRLGALYLNTSIRFDHPSPHPPTMGLLLLPLAWFDYPTASALWLVVEIACLASAVMMIGVATNSRLPAWAVTTLTLSLVGMSHIYEEIRNGQVNIVILTLLAGMWLARQQARPGLAGLLLGGSLLIKPLAWPLILLFAWRREWRVSIMAGLTVVIGYLLAIWRIGLGSFITYLEALPKIATLYSNMNNQSILVLVQDLTALLLGLALPADQVPGAARIAGIAVVAVVVVSALLVARGLPIRWAISLMVCVTIVASPIAWSFYLVLALIPVGCITRWLVDQQFPVRQTNQALAVAVLLLISWPVWNYLALLACGYTDAPAGNELASCVQYYVVRRGPALSIGALAWLTVELGRCDRV